jgi:TRAP-type mannitol/chloroaromatic compound transport system substrate-binding protein
MVEMGTKYGVKTMRWRDDQLAVFEQAWLDVLNEDAKTDAKFKEVADSYLSFRKAYSKWGAAQSMQATYLK